MNTIARTKPERTYTAAQQAARDYMEAQNIIDALDEQAAPQKAIQKAALDLLTDEYGENVKAPITGCWNDTLTFQHQVVDTVKWAKVVEALRSHLNTEQAAELDRLIGVHGSTRTTRKLTK